jgi:hypothetical protein
MTPLIASILNIQPLQLNKRFSVSNACVSHNEQLSDTLLNDIKLSVYPSEIKQIVIGTPINFDGTKLTLPAYTLSASQKRDLWNCICACHD